MSAINNILYHFTTIIVAEFGKKILQKKIAKNISNVPEFGNVAKVRNALPNSKVLPNSEISRTVLALTVLPISEIRNLYIIVDSGNFNIIA